MTTKHDQAILNSVFNPMVPIGELPIEELIDGELTDDEELNETVLEAKRYEIEAVKAAESGKIDAAIELLNKSIQVAPRRPSGYNNRAQAYRLKGDVDAAMDDLNNAISLGSGKGKSGCLAFCQRAIIHRLENREQESMADFKKAASLGSSFARAQLVQMNPYAALCNQMLRKVMAQYQ